MSVVKAEIIAGIVGMVGTAAGTSAAMMTGALVSAGALICGGMTTGMAVVAAAPLPVAAAAVGATGIIKRLIR